MSLELHFIVGPTYLNPLVGSLEIFMDYLNILQGNLRLLKLNGNRPFFFNSSIRKNQAIGNPP